ncbi:uncharacterized protein F5Z01DRAFT_614951 [Emericellopsis atlantica]|uniref:Uncharacterized protein n=1 Tax=Emericellopsis atlantica TaxID=2614577 RepID=A0A9P8CT32_9HYPO|nr:uncharacterized protein F5Z01DRAFT_614951 [Emericellopsis atlantica]KAG9258403.1 hypothetical protein F5Z01DRAFT_614951 [Emericellopsis atlantica]
MRLKDTKMAVSAAVFSPQSSPPKTTHLSHVRTRLQNDPRLAPLKEAVINLPQTLQALTTKHADLASLEDATTAVNSFPQWIENGDSSMLEQNMSGLVTLPLLTTIHIVQYLDYLQRMNLRHEDFLEDVEDGGIQGYCIGLLSAIAVACSANEDELIQHAVSGVQLALGIGAFGDLGAPTEGDSNTMQIRLKNQGDVESILKEFPGAYVSTITDAKTLSLIVPPEQMTQFKSYAASEGLRARQMHIRSNLHNKENSKLAEACTEILSDIPFPTSERLQVPVRSNQTGETLPDDADSMVEEAVTTILASQCNWSLVIGHLAEDLKETGKKTHGIALFGIGDSVPISAFTKLGLELYKTDGLAFTDTPPTPFVPPSSADAFPPDAIAIVGAACRLPGASSLDELWNIISQGQSRLEKLRTDRVNLKESYRASQDQDWVKKREFFGNFIDDVDAFDHSFFGISPREAKYMDPQQRLLLETAFEAMDSSGYLRHHKRDRGDAVGCFVGASYTEYLENTSAYSPSAFTATSTIRAFLSGKISYHFGWTGPSEVIDTACSASIVAVHRAVRAINAGECPIALAGGVNIITGVNNYFDLGKASFLSQTGQCKPFDDSADGYCRADGVGLVVLKPLSKAISDNDHIMGVIPAVATNQGGIGAPGITVPDGILQKSLYRGILESSGISPEQVTYVEAHGTGTQVGDPIEIGSIREVYGGAHRDAPLYLGSLKSNIGHSETAAGVASLIKVLAMLRNRGIPPLQGFKRLNHKIPPLEVDKMHIPTKLLPWDADTRIACINSYGASGSNSALLCSEWHEETPTMVTEPVTAPPQEYPILLSAASASSLQRFANELATYISKSNADVTLGNLSYTLSQRRKHHRIRWSATVTDLSSLIEKLQSCAPEDFSTAPPTTKSIVLTFSGQSRTTIGVSPSARQGNPRFEYYIQKCNTILQSYGCPDILPYLSQTETIEDATILQCGTVTVQYACAQCWIDGGLYVAGIVGHSLGELTALAVSGVLSLEDMLKAVYTRAELLKARWGPERGTMLAIHAKVDTVRTIMDVVESIIDHQDEALEIACYNSVTSHIVVGKEKSVAMAERIIQEDARFHGLRYQRLQTSHGFHSRFTEPLLSGLIAVERTIEFKKPAIPLETSTQQQVSFVNKSKDRYLANHARDPVYFVDAARRIESRLGECVWLEAGWSTPIISMVKRAVAKPAVHTFQPVTSPAAVAVELWREGIATTYWSFFTPKESGLKHIYLPPYSFDRPKYWLDHVDRAMEERRAAEAAKGETTQAPAKVQPMIVFKRSEGIGHHFKLHTETERYTRIVQGHAVRAKPLCPASVYMESAIMGINLLGAAPIGKTITFENVGFHRPLGCDDNLDVELVLQKGAEDDWHYAVSSGPRALHSDGNFSATTSEVSDLQLYEMLLADKMETLRNDTDAEKLRTSTAYKLFSRVVEYSALLRGITSITLGSRQAIAQVKVPKSTWAAEGESSVTDFYDAVALDTFIQVLGLLINSDTGSSADDEIYVASSIGKMVVSPTDFTKPQTWTVYATYSTSDSKTSSGAVFVFNEEGKLSSFATKVQFMRIKAAKLERVLESANPNITSTLSSLEASVPSMPVPVQRPTSAPTSAPRSVTLAAPAPDTGKIKAKIADLRALISVYTGVPVEEMRDDQSFGNMGLDSLASMELADEMESKLNLKVQAEDLLLGTVGSLISMLPGASGELMSSNSIGMVSDDTSSESSGSFRGTTGLPTSIPATPTGFSDNEDEELGMPWKRPEGPLNSRFKMETVVYKDEEGVQVPADIYVPSEAAPNPMPVGLSA